ncbi:DUF4145 domain-containing protein [Vibrio hannami]|uniref:DUF4145 domain-containing protein n=1 Tax=Vibrio hannami TaxID=2717094 RepID=UPI0024104236|nr:DUF4145 domain-containing protein [Vibrio hannami]MDG3086670.1 DUF4145 domain-containing protein [Vibrio hannami]
MSDIERVVVRTRRLEKLLRVQYHADGKGLHQLITSSEERLPHDVISKLRYVATIRNKIVHEENYELEDSKAFFSVCDDCEQELTPRASRFIWRVAIAVMILFTLVAMGFYYVHWDKLAPHL